MYINRDIEGKITKAIENYTKPICILGARQVGKSTTVKYCLKGQDYIYVNMFDTHHINDVFNELTDLSVNRIISSLELILERNISVDTILVFDEIQSNPSALASLKSFNEDGRFKVIALGSNLGSFLLTKSKHSFPVGQYQRLNMYPLSYVEYLNATGNSFLCDSFCKGIRNGEINDILHFKLLDLFDQYMTIGGMPEAVKSFLIDPDITAVDNIKHELVEGYLSDFGKFEYAIDNVKALNAIYKSIPMFLNKDNQKFIFSEINYEYKQLTKVFKWLQDNNYIVLTPQINTINLPLVGNVKESAFKLFSSETSLLLNQANYDVRKIIREKDQIYYGFVMENYIATVLSKYNEIYTYRKAKTEIDFIYQSKGQVVAIEVKSGSNKKAKSLQTLKQNNPDVIAIKLTRDNLSIGTINTIPLYAIDYILQNQLLDMLVD